MKITSKPISADPVKVPMVHTLVLSDDEMQILKWVVACRMGELGLSTYPYGALTRLYKLLPGPGTRIDDEDLNGIRRAGAFR